MLAFAKPWLVRLITVGKHCDQLLVESDPVVGGGSLSADPCCLRLHGREHFDRLCLGLGRADYLGNELLLAKLGVAFGYLCLFGEDILLSTRRREGTGLSGFRLSSLYFGVVLRPSDGSLTGVLRLVAVRLLTGLSRGLISGRLGNRRGLVHRGNVGLAQSPDVPGALIIDRFDL